MRIVLIMIIIARLSVNVHAYYIYHVQIIIMTAEALCDASKNYWTN